MLSMNNINKVFRTDLVETTALRDFNLTIDEGDFVSVTGPSGSGKTTFLNIAGLLETYTSGQYVLDGTDVSNLSDRQRSQLRNEKIGFIFQSFNLIPDLNLYDNVDVPLRYRGFSKQERHKRITQSLERVGLANRMKHLPAQLSGGQQQRVAIARALAGEPRFLLADEPTGNLDSQMAKSVMALLQEINQQGTTIVMVTHDPELAMQTSKNVFVRDGQISEHETLVPVALASNQQSAQDTVMFYYYLKLASKSIKRTPWLSGLMMLAIALGIGACMTTITVNYLMSANPIPEKSDQLYYVQLDSWSPHFAAREPNEPPDQLTWTDATNLMQAQQAFRQSAMASSGGVVQPDNPDVKPFMASLRLNFADFFPMFNAPFLYGSGWQYSDDVARKQVAVISKETNDRVFGGENSVGKSITIAGEMFTVVGVLDEWVLVPRFYDVTTGAFSETEDVFIPFYMKQVMQLSNGGNTNCWKSPEGEGFEAFLMSECINYQMWVELPTDADRDAYMTFLNAYVDEQKALGRFPRPHNNRLSDVMTWMETEEVVADDAQIMMYMAFLFLFVCILNTVGLLLSKFATRNGDVALRRAIGATKGAIFAQYITETALIGLIGGVLGLALASLGLQAIESLYGDFISELVHLDATMVMLSFGIAITASVLAGCYPAWRVCSIPPASQLKTQ